MDDMKYRVWAIRNVPGNPKYYDVDSPVDGADLINTLARKDLKNKNIISNAFGLEVCWVDGGEWEEWYSNEGDDIDVLSDERWEQSE
jgi:hypothetical protein